MRTEMVDRLTMGIPFESSWLNGAQEEARDRVVMADSWVYDRLMENISSRGRDYEREIEWEYLSQLNEIYNQYFLRYDKGNLLVINTNNIDFVNNKKDLDQILNVIKTPFSGTKFFNPEHTLG